MPIFCQIKAQQFFNCFHFKHLISKQNEVLCALKNGIFCVYYNQFFCIFQILFISTTLTVANGIFHHQEEEDPLASIEQDLAQLQPAVPAAIPVAIAKPPCLHHHLRPQVVVQRVPIPILVTHRVPYPVVQKVPVQVPVQKLVPQVKKLELYQQTFNLLFHL